MNESQTNSIEKKSLKIFVSSPGDVAEERTISARIIKRLQECYKHLIEIEPIFWEHEPLRGSKSFQEEIPLPSETDVFICILWSRLGTRIPLHVTKGEHKTGTEFEFEDALHACKEKGVPELYIYKNITEPPSVSLVDENDYKSRKEQWDALNRFWDDFSRDEENMSFVVAFQPYENTAEFEEKLETHLTKIIDTKIPEYQRAQSPPATWIGQSPYRSLEYFDVEHAPIFFGRTKEISKVISAMSVQMARKKAFVMITGGSGSGKSSLARAGVLPMITEPGIIEGIGVWRWAIFEPGIKTKNTYSNVLLGGLIEALTNSDHALPELLDDEITMDELYSILQENPRSIHESIRGVLSLISALIKQTESLENKPQARFLLLIDQFEQIFHDEYSEMRDDFITVIDSLARGGRVCVLMTMRIEFYPQFQNNPLLAALSEEAGQVVLAPPTISELTKMIREPAIAAGLRFDIKPTGERLDEIIVNDASTNPENLSLVEFSLDLLYKRKSEENLLTFSEYERMGGIYGALETIANETWETWKHQHPSNENAFNNVIHHLIHIDQQDDNKITRKYAELSLFLPTSPERSFVEHFVNARLLKTDEREKDHVATVTVVHESLFSSWKHLNQWIEKNRELLQIKRRIGQAFDNWKVKNQHDDYLLPSGNPLIEAESLLQSHRQWLEDDLIEYIQYSSQTAKDREQDLRNQFARVDFLLACEKIEQNHPEHALAYLVHALELNPGFETAQVRLYTILSQYLWPKLILTVNGKFHFIEDKWIFSPLDVKTIQLWDLNTVKPICEPLKHEDEIDGIEFCEDGKRIITYSNNNTIFVWDIDTSKNIFHYTYGREEYPYIHISPDAKSILIVSLNTVRVFDTEKGIYVCKPTVLGHRVRSVKFNSKSCWIVISYSSESYEYLSIFEMPTGISILQDQNIRYLEFSPVRDSFVTISEGEGVQVWNAATFRPLSKSIKQDNYVDLANISPDGCSIATVALGRVVRIWTIFGSLILEDLSIKEDDFIEFIKFSPDGKLFVTCSWRNEIRIYNIPEKTNTGIVNHDQKVESVQIDPNSGKILSITKDNTVHVWNVNGDSLCKIKHGDHNIESAIFDNSGKNIVLHYNDNRILLWDTINNMPMCQPFLHDCSICSIKYSPKRCWLISETSLSQQSSIWEIPSRISFIDSNTCQLTSNYNYIITANGVWVVIFEDNNIHMYNTSIEKLYTNQYSCNENIKEIYISPKGNVLLTVTENQITQIWDIDTGRLVGHPTFCREKIIELSREGNYYLTISKDDSVIRVLNSKTGEKINEFSNFDIYQKHYFSPDERWIVTHSSRNSNDVISVWEILTGKPFSEGFFQKNNIQILEFSPDGHWMLTGSHDGKTQLWDIFSEYPTNQLLICDRVFDYATFSPDGLKIAISFMSEDIVLLWDTENFKEICKPIRYHINARTIQFSPNGQYFVIIYEDESVHIYESETGRPIATLMQQKDMIHQLEFSPDGCWLLISMGNTIQIMETVSGNFVSEKINHISEFNARFSADSKKIILFSNDSVQILKIVPQKFAQNSEDIKPLTELASYLGGYEIDQNRFIKPIDKRVDLLDNLKNYRNHHIWGDLIRYYLDTDNEKTEEFNKEFFINNNYL
jgi:WD40 repeat protein/energy-coupling factor transporter ATP-binding protein EcfA2